ncbi:polyprenyl diphosphate synthase [Sulfurisphaera ohwakuensis]|uniref:Tritrans,polycis-undecaprenyl-diphosphate synthase (geranylgeranyl-diphosphate specific) n=1 Tax=Sulfurisphaera ohwakuensis TaxID=69656 RepID=A0A650CDG9_SULOH|nr:polyprenyl diphosphate synthase [Sulfurisphaera ohwakuensis]MBB5253272.1 tritrans,polycis-undecaprenyl-diphosphate synthase [geranylgeranyl-diphosphate specific] [Sulfurisphaera ohwakuensis]QGR15824.1 di-trans,poly-cis-decaprenylcistransferase [Sulfurisphaera ohwakuensis]
MFKEKVGKIILYPVYKFYEKILWNEIKNGPFPQHVGIIPDGNRRWARANNLSINDAYYNGYRKLKQVLLWLLEMGIKNITVFALSTENCDKRSNLELNTIFNYIKAGLEELLYGEIIYKYEVKVRAIGLIYKLPLDLLEVLNQLSKKTENFNKRKLTLAICYGGRQEIIDATKKIIADYEKGKIKLDDINENIFRQYLYDKELEDIDLVIRSSGEIRISNFLLWHIAYSELFFVDTYWPDFRKIDLWRAIRSYQKRKRNFGA